MPHRSIPNTSARLTLLDVAKALGVSRTTVSNAFNRPDQLSRSLREQIIQGARNLGYYGPDPSARALRRMGIDEVAVVFFHDLPYVFSDPYCLNFLQGVATELDARQLNLQLIPKLGWNAQFEKALHTTAGAMIVMSEIPPEIVPEVLASRKPIVLIDALLPGVVTLSTDDRGGAALAMDYVLSHRPDAVIAICFRGREHDLASVVADLNPARTGPIAIERIAGYAQAVRKAGFPLEQVHWIEVDPRQPESAAAQVEALRPRFKAGTRLGVVAMSDRFALSARTAVANWAGVETVALAGFDDIPAAAAAGLSTVRQDARLKGLSAVRALLDGAGATLIPAEFIRRDT